VLDLELAQEHLAPQPGASSPAAASSRTITAVAYGALVARFCAMVRPEVTLCRETRTTGSMPRSVAARRYASIVRRWGP
jgi:hypothetical protein